MGHIAVKIGIRSPFSKFPAAYPINQTWVGYPHGNTYNTKASSEGRVSWI